MIHTMPKPKRSRPTALERRVATRDPKKRVYVVCEGSKTEPHYLSQVLATTQSAVVDLIVVDCDHTAPKKLVEHACMVKRELGAAATKGSRAERYGDEVWCVFDVDDHVKLLEARQQAVANEVFTAVSNPCVELWFLLHVKDQRRNLHRDEANRELKRLLGHYEKGEFSLDPFRGKYSLARERARSLDAKHDGDGTRYPSDNPSSGVWRLIDSLGASY